MKNQIVSTIQKALGVFILAVAIVPAANANKDKPMDFTNPAQGAYLMVQSAHAGDIKQDKATGTYNILLKKVAPYVTCFSERPDRKTGSMPISNFLKLWEHKGQDGFEANPPNAYLHATGEKASQALNVPVELTKPVYDSKKETLSYTIRPLQGAEALPEAAKVNHVLLFIDDVCLSCW